jgi:hypothetical protein
MTTTDIPPDHPAAVLALELREVGADTQGKGSLAAILAGKRQLRALLASTAVSCLGAGRFVYERDGAKKGWRELPDYSTRLKACEFLADRLDGRPVQTEVNLHADAAGGRLTAADLLQGAPNAEKVLLELLGKVRSGRLRGDQG